MAHQRQECRGIKSVAIATQVLSAYTQREKLIDLWWWQYEVVLQERLSILHHMWQSGFPSPSCKISVLLDTCLILVHDGSMTLPTSVNAF
jgi:hypothetical protein